MLRLGTVLRAGARVTNTCARPHQAVGRRQSSVPGWMRGMMAGSCWRGSVPGHPCVPPVLISSQLVGRHGTHRLEELRAALTLQITNEMGFQLLFSLPGLLVCRAPADELPVTPYSCEPPARPRLEPSWRLALRWVMPWLRCPGRGAGTGTGAGAGAGTGAGTIAAPLWVTPSLIPTRVLEVYVYPRVWRRERDLSFIPGDPLSSPGLPRPLGARMPVHVASTPAHCHQRCRGGAPPRGQAWVQNPVPPGKGAEGAGVRLWWLLSRWQPGTKPRQQLAGRRHSLCLSAPAALLRSVLPHVVTLPGPKRCRLHRRGQASAAQGVPQTVPRSRVLGLLPIFATSRLAGMGSARPDARV